MSKEVLTAGVFMPDCVTKQIMLKFADDVVCDMYLLSLLQHDVHHLSPCFIPRM